MHSKQQGFTLIELIAVIVILGILAATAMPRFANMSDGAEMAAAQGVAATISSSATTNFAAAMAGSATAHAITHAADACANAANSVFAARADFVGGNIVLLNTGAPANTNQFVIAPAAGSGACARGENIQCTITSRGGQVATAHVPCTN